jgi:hypothetical protein
VQKLTDSQLCYGKDGFVEVGFKFLRGFNRSSEILALSNPLQVCSTKSFDRTRSHTFKPVIHSHKSHAQRKQYRPTPYPSTSFTPPQSLFGYPPTQTSPRFESRWYDESSFANTQSIFRTVLVKTLGDFERSSESNCWAEP